MKLFQYKDKEYEIDSGGFLLDFDQWDEDFAEGMSPNIQIDNGLTKAHWDVISFIRDTFKELGKCPLVYQTCRMNKLSLKHLRSLFPTGYLRGACKLAGITYKEGYLKYSWVMKKAEEASTFQDKTYTVDIRGFLVNPDEWDEQFAIYKAFEMKMPDEMTSKHWQIIHFLRENYKIENRVPTVYDTCEANDIEIEELEELFPDGYHRGVVKLAGLRVR